VYCVRGAIATYYIRCVESGNVTTNTKRRGTLIQLVVNNMLVYRVGQLLHCNNTPAYVVHCNNTHVNCKLLSCVLV
jgi:hypothetical protein